MGRGAKLNNPVRRFRSCFRGSDGPFADLAAFTDWVTVCAKSDDPLFYALIDKATGRASGMASFLRIVPETKGRSLEELEQFLVRH